ncbi:hypothetical protein GRI39_06545 [Altererythrobacter indicus]|uniref:Translocation and assembly module TamB C-terminal domain-containing protein n=1 Tax=Altericroceibacterium indicum TaxID=374177 RepID=A0A845A674_9SPHN|nr:translocation/assembly module TamB domain-containing protein [Altericroceibacterium indicum]MXP25700.1 hypothetical protein [Altericroceibacterium indicum]
MNEGEVQAPDETGTAEPVKRRRGPIRFVLRWSARVVFALLGIVALAVIFLHTPPGRQFIVDQLSSYAPASGLKVEVGEIDGSVLWGSTLKDVRFFDKNNKLFLEIPEVELNWRPYKFPLIGLDIRHLIAHDGTLHAVPQFVPGNPDAPILPDFDIRVDQFVVDNLHVDKGVAGDERTVNLRAKTNIRDGLVYFKANGSLGGGDHLAALIHAQPDRDIFKADVNIDAPADGLIANLSNSTKGFMIDIRGDGTWKQWDGAILAKQEEKRLVALALHNSNGQYTIAGQIRPEGRVKGLAGKALGDLVSVGAVGTLKQSTLAGNLALRSKALTLDTGGAVDLNDKIFHDFSIKAKLADPSLMGGSTKIGNAELNATMNGAFDNLSVQHQLRIGEIDLGKTHIKGITQNGVARYDGTRWSAPLDLRIKRIVTGNKTIDPRLTNGRATGLLQLKGDMLTASSLPVTFDNLKATLALKADLAKSNVEVSGPVEARGFVLDNIGTLDLGAKFRFRLNDGPWTLRANVTGRMPRVTNGTLADIAGTNIRFNGGLGLSNTGRVEVDNFKLRASKLQLDLNGRMGGNDATLAGTGRHTKYGPFTIEAELNADGPRAVLVLKDPMPAAGLKDVRVALTPSGDGYAIETEGNSRLGPFNGALQLTMPTGEPTHIDVQHFDIWKTSLTGGVTLQNEGVLGTLTLSGGGLDGRVAFSPRDGGQGVEVNLAANNAVFAGPTPVAIRRATITASALLKEGATTINGSIRARGLSYGSMFIGSLAAQARVQDGTGLFDAQLTGRRGSRFELQMQGKVTPDQVIVAAKGAYGTQAIDTPRRAVLSKREDGGWTLQKSQLSFGSGFVIVEGNFGGERPTEASVKLANMPLSLIDAVADDTRLGGSVSGAIDIKSSEEHVPTGKARLMVKGLTRAGLTMSSRPINLALVLDLSPTLLQTRAVINDGTATKGRLQGRIANLPADGNLIERLQAGNLLAQLRYAGPAESLWRLLSIEVFDITGPMRAAADVGGSLKNPQVRGSLQADNLHLTSAITGSDVTNLRARGTFRGSRLNMTTLAGTTANGGTIAGSGFVDLAGLGKNRGPVIDLRLSAKRAQVVKRKGMGATVTGPIRIMSNGSGGTIAGRLQINAAEWTLGRAEAENNLPDIQIREINLPADIAPADTPGEPWRYLIDAKAKDNVKVRGMGLDSEWSADLQLRGTTDDPRIGGTASVIPRQGFYSFASTQFDLTRGQIDFDVNGPIDPRLDITATSSDVANLDVTVRVTGSGEQPTVSFQSTPSLPEEEILARLLFGGSITDLSATDAIQLGAALAALRSGGGLDPINSLRSAIGLDRLRIVAADPTLDRETAVALGKNFGRRFYTEIITDGRGYNASTVEFRVTSWLSLLASISSIGREGVSAEVSKDY